ncbi:3,4-dihydroxy-2-butanone 4-phosphate synthase [Cladophialophora yegresii CBS 114405]|uniref:3,4-dihydroxy-2-butanone 4-phosphate synthase n=1 Tax=Cladophialophora yegresii CBS 114405 TaxID=1182544 RepID=W9X0F3_9EURO|nr:3,4-dihydroxy-2-butanone 4-phosphate synthase [Cladophialophora yegresii CBS 114405]EXJ63969.1 3,4-dihydroxy-2-butanone 4-phosphate synthase [Cladophialophora yegresii CBS 114405]
MQPPSTLAKGFDSIESTIQAFRNGEFIVVLDSQDRENEGDLIIAAQDVTTEKMAFMVRYTSGLICAPITSQLASELDLPQMVVDNEDPNRTAYTISIDSNDESVTTGISAHDRALTCRTLASPKATAASFRRPGHVFPLRARDGGVLERTGHTEAAVEFCRLAGKAKAGVICEMVDDGEPVPGQTIMREPGMMRRDACLEFGRKWGLKVCTIEDLVEYVRREKEGQKSGNGQMHGNGVVMNGVNGVSAASEVNGRH